MNHRTPRGKIGRLPKGIQDEVNRRMENGARGASNSDAGVQAPRHVSLVTKEGASQLWRNLVL
jgi:hypothetical protein